MDSGSFYARLNSLRDQLKLPALEQRQSESLDAYLIQRTDKETNTYLNHTFTGSGDLQLDELQQSPQHGLEDQLKEWVHFGKQKEEEISLKYEQIIEEMKRQYEEIAVRFEQNTAERLKNMKNEHLREIEEISRSLEETKSALREAKRGHKDRETAFLHLQEDKTRLQNSLEATQSQLHSCRTDYQTLQTQSQSQVDSLKSELEALRHQLAVTSSQLRDQETDLISAKRELSQVKSYESALKETIKGLEEDNKEKAAGLETLRTELVEQSKEVAKLVQASKDLAEQRNSEREYLMKSREEMEGLEGLKYQLEREIAELAAKRQEGVNDFIEEYEERYQKAVKVADMWKGRADYTLAKFYTFARTMRLEVLTLRNEVVDWQETALTEFTRTVAQITRKYKYMLEDMQDSALRPSRKGKKGKKPGAVSLL